MENTKRSFGKKFIEAQDKFFKGKWSMISFTLAVLIFGILQMLLFLLTDFEVSGSSDINHWQSWLYMVISPLGAALSLAGYVYSVRVDSRFFVPTVVGQMITLVNSYLGGMVWTGTIMFVILGFSFARMFIIKKLGSAYKFNFKKTEIISYIVVFLLSVVGIFIALYEPIYSSFWYTGDTSITYRLLDVLTANLAIIGSVMLVTKNKNAFYIFTFCNVIFIVMFGLSGLWMNSIQLFIYIVCNLCAVAAWTYKSKHENDFK